MDKSQLSLIRCKHCKKHLHAKTPGKSMRFDKQFCDASCRAAYSRHIAKMGLLSSKIGAALHELGKYLDDPDTEGVAVEYFDATIKMVRFEAQNRGYGLRGLK